MSKRPDYARLRGFLKRGGVLQREQVYEAPIALTRPDPAGPAGPTGIVFTGPAKTLVVWRAAKRDGTMFDADTASWLASRDSFRISHTHYVLAEDPAHPGIYRAHRLPPPTPGELPLTPQAPHPEETP